MIKIEKLSYGFPAKDLYNNISFNIERGQHCALIGSNGTGKSTLVDMIMDPEEYLYDGKIIKDDECRIGYASQFSVHDKSQECTVFEYLSRRFVELQMEIARVCEEMATADPKDMEKVFERYQELLDRNEAVDGDNYDSNIDNEQPPAPFWDFCLYNFVRYRDFFCLKNQRVTGDSLIFQWYYLFYLGWFVFY